MQVGDLIQKRWGRIEPYQQGTLALYLGKHRHSTVNPAFRGYSIKVFYPGRKIEYYREEEFIVIKGEKRVPKER